ncbi:oxygen-dependent protoporphyrinogen oxidase [Monascus purpureus]|uniref:Protoporphyrinogen oxidase n=1 Tax=Monascus purpureus TaxID=5098 RepID=A0A507QK76_MONPU|nr:oxygen-dependent protoporphyrinogen oxidase [Monascus purpureus]BDD61046.1 hypothetical protein MAP00_006126 [Monascus purpureus]
MQLSCVSSRASRGVRRQLLFQRIRNGSAYRRSLHTQPFDAAIIGGGITSLTAAYRLSQQEDCKKVTLYEKSARPGGLLQSEVVPVDGGDVVFEYGPRTLRTGPLSCLPLVNLVSSLGLADDIVPTSKRAAASTNRYIYYPDHLVRMPAPYPDQGALSFFWSSFRTVTTEPVFESFLSGIFGELSKLPRPHVRDESVARFISRRFNQKIADNLVSALYHGIYAGDINVLSAKALLGPYWDLEMKDSGVALGFVDMKRRGRKFRYMDDFLAMTACIRGVSKENRRAVLERLAGASVFTFKRGIGQLAEALVDSMKESGKVEIITDARVNSISQNTKTSDLTIRFGHNDSNSRVHNRVIATTPAPELAKILDTRSPKEANQNHPSKTVRSLQEYDYAVSVMIVNLYYPSPDIIPVEGFGYLIPQSIPMEQNPERALGVIFGSQTSIGQDTAPGTKVTVMLGGHWWDDWEESDLPDHDTAVSMARSLLERHLGIKDTPSVARTRLQRNAIPQYTVGHMTRMQELSNNVREEFHHRLTLAGNWYGDAGVTDCVKQAYLASTYGMGAKLSEDNEIRMLYGSEPWTKYAYREWDLEGGIVTSPVRFFEQSEPMLRVVNAFPAIRRR